MTRKAVLHALASHLDVFLLEYGFDFRKQKGVFARQFEGGEHRIRLHLNKWPGGKHWEVTFQVQIRFDRVEEILNRYFPDRASKLRETPTLSYWLSRLSLGAVPDWEVRSEEDVDAIVPRMKDAVRRFVLPWFASLPDLKALEKTLEEKAFGAGGDLWVLVVCLALREHAERFHAWLSRLGEWARTKGVDREKEKYFEFERKLRADFPHLFSRNAPPREVT